jgi:hypothetical protein
LPVVKLLVENGAKIDRADREGMTAVSWATEPIVLAELVVQEFDSPEDARRALEEAPPAPKEDMDQKVQEVAGIIEFLLDHGADVNHQDKSGRTPLQRVANGQIAALLKSRGAF